MLDDIPIGAGAQADIYRGRFQGMAVAVKVARTTSKAAEDQMREFARREVRALSRVQVRWLR